MTADGIIQTCRTFQGHIKVRHAGLPATSSETCFDWIKTLLLTQVCDFCLWEHTFDEFYGCKLSVIEIVYNDCTHVVIKRFSFVLLNIKPF